MPVLRPSGGYVPNFGLRAGGRRLCGPGRDRYRPAPWTARLSRRRSGRCVARRRRGRCVRRAADRSRCRSSRRSPASRRVNGARVRRPHDGSVRSAPSPVNAWTTRCACGSPSESGVVSPRPSVANSRRRPDHSSTDWEPDTTCPSPVRWVIPVAIDTDFRVVHGPHEPDRVVPCVRDAALLTGSNCRALHRHKKTAPPSQFGVGREFGTTVGGLVVG